MIAPGLAPPPDVLTGKGQARFPVRDW